MNISSSEPARKTDFSTQYFRTYTVRLKCISDILAPRIAERWGASANIKQLTDIVPDEKCVIVGTLYKEMANKPTVLKELTESYQLGVRPAVSHKFISDDDRMFLEDAQQRIALQLDQIGKTAASFVTGVVLAILGHEPEQSKGIFVAEELLFATPAALPPSLPLAPASARFVAIISGLRFSGDAANDFLPLQLFFDWLSGSLPVASVALEPASVGRLIVAGNLVECDPVDVESGSVEARRPGGGDDADPLELLDRMLGSLCQSIPVDLIVGPDDPSPAMLPQEPLHPVLFPRASMWSTFHTRPNPWMFSLADGRFAIGTAGQPIDDIDRNSNIDDPLDRLAATIEWGHVAPTAPDTLHSYPNADESDPLIMPHRPALYFAGNQARFQWRHDAREHTLLVAVPCFKESGEVAIVDMETMSCRSLVFR